MVAFARQWFFAAVLVALTTLPVAAQQDEKVEIFIANNRSEAITMRFDYAFRQYTWNLIQANVAANDDVTYRFPANIPGCERLREWHIADGLLTISNARGPLCQKRISLCDRYQMKMDVGNATCQWRVGQ